MEPDYAHVTVVADRNINIIEKESISPHRLRAKTPLKNLTALGGTFL